MTKTYVPPACGNDGVTNTRPATTFWGWECADCGGPLRLTDRAAGLLTGHPDPSDSGPMFVHDTKSDFYWKEA